MFNLNFFGKKKVSKFDPTFLLCNKKNFFSSEAYKLLRTNIMFTVPDEGKCRVIGITSATRGEGKSTTAINLSYVIAETGKKVLLIDGDLRLPSVSKKLGIPTAPGLSDAIATSEDALSVIRKTDLENWDILPAGNIPPNPSEMLGSAQMAAFLTRLQELYDFIVVDLPPVTIVSDALALSPILSGIALVIRSNYSKRRELHASLKSLELGKVKILGVIVNAKKRSISSNYRYKRYSHDGYYGYSTPASSETNNSSENTK